MLPAAEGKCPDCATDHDPQLPHNQQSLFWNYRFLGLYGRWPTWADALAHCDDETAKMWIGAMPEHGGPVVTMKEIEASRVFITSKKSESAT